MDRIENRTRLTRGPHGVAVDAEIAEPQAQAARLGELASGQCLQPELAPVGEELGERGVLLAVFYRVQAERGGLRRWIDLGRVQPQSSLPRGVGGIDGDSARRFPEALSQDRIGVAAHLAEAHEIGVGVQHHQAQVRLGQQLLQDHPERVGLARPGLAAQERVPVEAAGIRPAGHISGLRQLAQPQLGVVPRAALEPGLHLRPGGDANQHIVKGRRVAFENRAFTARVLELDLCPGLLGASRGAGQHQLRVQPVELEGDDLAKPRRAVTLQHHVAANLQLQTIQGGLEREPAPVDRGSKRKD